MLNPKLKYPVGNSLYRRLWHDSEGNKRPYRDWTPHTPIIPIYACEQALIEQVQSVLAALPTYANLEQDAIEKNTCVDISTHLSLPDGYFVFLENDTTPIRKPQDKPATNSPLYYRENWRMRIGTSDELIKRLQMGHTISTGICDRVGDTIRQGVLQYASQGILLDCDEFNDGSPQKSDRPNPCYSMDAFLNQHPEIKDVARYIIPSTRSLFDGRPFKARAWVPFEIPVSDHRVFERIAEKLNEMFPFLPQAVTKNPIAAACGAAHNAHLARHFDGCISRNFIEQCQQEVLDEQQKQEKRKKQQHKQEIKRKARRRRQQKRKSKLRAKGYDIKDTISPIEVFIKEVNPIAFMEQHGWLTDLGGVNYHWHESSDGKSCEISILGDNRIVIKPFSASMQSASPNAEKPVGGHRFLLYYLYGLDVNNKADKPQLRRRLAEDGYGTHPDEYKKIIAAEKHAAKAEGLVEHTTTTNFILTPDKDDDFVKSILDDTLDVPEIEIREEPAYKHWTPEQKIVCEKIVGRDPDAGWYQNPQGVWTSEIITAYRNFERMTGLDAFKMNGQPNEMEKNRLFFAKPGVCPTCYGTAALSIDKNLLTAHNWCPTCHVETQIGSYLNYELNRKIENAVVSKYQGFLGDNPDFKHFELFRPGQLTYLGAAMATGKTTEIVNEIIRRVITENKRGIICVPRVSLARAIAHHFRKIHGHNAWGLWHEGAGKANQFIGTKGAIVCPPSLVNAVDEAYEQGLTLDDLLIAIDELDFSYQLLNLAIKQKLRIKHLLTEILNINGLVVAGQTEFTLALEAFAAELGVETTNIHAFYNTASVAEGIVEITTYPDVEGKTDLARADAMDIIIERLEAGKNVYVFCHERRDVQMLAKIFSHLNPVLYTAYHKGDKRADSVLLNQKITDTNLFIATSSAGVGINIHDKNAETVIIAGPIYGKRDIPMTTQEKLRNRARTNVHLFLPPYATPLPIAPAETEAVSSYEHGLKLSENGNDKALPEAAIKRFATTTALVSLADADPMTFFKHHIEKVAGMKIVEKEADLEKQRDIKTIKETRTETRNDERDAVTQRILEILNAPKLHVMTSTQIRAQGAAGKLLPMPIEQLAQERLNQAAQALGYDDTETNDFEFINKELLKELILNVTDLRELKQQYNGWLAVHHTEWMHQQFEQKLKKNLKGDSVNAGEGDLEITDIEDYRIHGTLLTKLLEALKGTTYTQSTLSETIRNVIKTRYGHHTLWEMIQNGALSLSGYRAARFWHIANEQGFVKWASDFVSKWYPVRIAKRKDTYYLTPQTHANIKARVFQTCLAVQQSYNNNNNSDDDGNPPPFIDGFCETPDPRSEQKARARQLVSEGNTAKYAAEKTELPYECVRKLTKDIRDIEKSKQIEIALRLREQGNTLQDIALQIGVTETTISRWCKGFVDEKLQSSLLAECTVNFQLRTRSWNFAADSASKATLQNQILKLLHEEKQLRTEQIVESLEAHPVSIKKVLKELTDTGEIIKLKHGTYALPADDIEQAFPLPADDMAQPKQEQVADPPIVSNPQLPQVLCDVHRPEVSHDTEVGVWFAIYLIHNALTDRSMRTCEHISAKTGLATEVCSQTLDFMYQNVLVNAGVGETYWMDDDARRRCMTHVLATARLPILVLYTYFLTHAAYFQHHQASSRTGKEKRTPIDKADQMTHAQWEACVYQIGIRVAVMAKTIRYLQTAAAQQRQRVFEKQKKGTVF